MRVIITNKRGEGEFHGCNAKAVAAMGKFRRAPAEDFDLWRSAADEHQPLALKDLLQLRPGLRPAIELDEVEPIEEIRLRFTTAGMSLGALSPEAHEALAIAMNQIGGKSNSGEGGEDPARYSIRPNTQREDSRAKFKGKPENVIHFLDAVAEDVRRILASLGAGSLNEIIGRTELLTRIDDPANPRTRLLDLLSLLHKVDPSGEVDRHHTRERNERFGSEGLLDSTTVQGARDVILGKSQKLVRLPDHEFLSRRRDSSFRPDCLPARRQGPARGRARFFVYRERRSELRRVSGGRRTADFARRGERLRGQGMSGGEIIVRPKADELFAWEKNCIVGNTCLYGATGGALFAAGRAGERFAVRNSGATAMIDGVGDHGCDYMTGGVVVVLQRTGKNFAAGISGGLAFVHDADGSFAPRHNAQMSSADRLTNPAEIGCLRQLLGRHVEWTASPFARGLLNRWETTVAHSWKIIPHPPQADSAKPFLQWENFKVAAA